MEAGMRKRVMIGLIVVCLVLAGLITLATFNRTDASLDRFAGQMQLVKCRNPNCAAEYEVNKKEYFEYLVEHRNPRVREAPPLVCKKCNEPSVYAAVKCQKCGLVFEVGSIPRDYDDRCPKCGYSKQEEERKAAAPSGGG